MTKKEKQKLLDMLAVQRQCAHDTYTTGMHNGLELAYSTLVGRPPRFIEPKKVLFEITSEVKDEGHEVLNTENFHVQRGKASSTEVAYAAVIFLSTLYADNVDSFVSRDGFLNYLRSLWDASEIGIPGGSDGN